MFISQYVEDPMRKVLLPVLILLLTACTQAASPTHAAPTEKPTPNQESADATQEFELGTYSPQQIEIELADPEPFDIQMPSVQYFDGIGSLYLDQGIYYALVGGFDQDTDYYYVYQAVSQNGLEWVFNESDLTAHDLFEGGSCVPRQLLRPNAQEWIYYAQCNDGTQIGDPAYIIYLTAPAFTGPWSWNPEPIVGGNSAEDTPVWLLNLTPIPTGYRMYVYFPVSARIGVAQSEDGYSWEFLTQGSEGPDNVFTVQDGDGQLIPVRRVEAVWQEGERWYMIYLAPAPTDGSMEAYTPSYSLASGPDGLHWVSIGEVTLPFEEMGGTGIITSVIPKDDLLVATLCRWADEGGMTCFLGTAEKPSGHE